MKTKIPDGKGGWTEVEGERVEGSKANEKKQNEIYQQEFIEDAGSLTESIIKFDQALIKEKGLSKEHRVFAAALYCVNLRDTYPDGTEAFDVIATAAAEYYDKNAPKRPKKP